jgi:hypothetical protein
MWTQKNRRGSTLSGFVLDDYINDVWISVKVSVVTVLSLREQEESQVLLQGWCYQQRRALLERPQR